MRSEDIDDLLEQEFPVEYSVLYLNHAAVAPWPLRTGDAVRRFAGECVDVGARNFPHWTEVEATLRERLARFLNAPSTADIALLKNTSEGLSTVAHGFPWAEGDNVVVPQEEFPSNRIVWESLSRYGVTARFVPIQNESDPETALLAACDGRTRLLAASSVQYATGLRLNLTALGRGCRERGVAFCVDAIQGLGVFKHDIQAMGIDFLVADAHKWLLGPEGIAVFYCSAAWRSRLTLHEYGWHMVEDYLNYDTRDWEPAASARRFECGSQNMLGIHALAASLSLFEEIGMAEIERRILARADLLFEEIAGRPELHLLTRPEPGRYAGIVTFRHRSRPAKQLFQDLRSQDVICAARGGGIRFSPHAYTRPDTLARAMAMIEP